MKKAVVIGGCGKVGSYLVPMLVQEGYAVTSVSRGVRAPMVPNDAWKNVQKIVLDRGEETFAQKICELNPDIVVDMICFSEEEMMKLVNALRGRVQHYLVCGSAWVHGYSTAVPVREEDDRNPEDAYGIGKNQMERRIEKEYRDSGFPGTVIHPGHIVCPGDPPINPQGNKNMAVFETLKKGETLYLPNFGLETLHHVHAEDIAGVFMAAIRAGKPTFGQDFHAVSARAVTLRGYAEEVARWYGQEAHLVFEPYAVWKNRVSAQDAAMTLEHISKSPCCSMDKAREILNFVPAHSTYEAVRTCLISLDAL